MLLKEELPKKWMFKVTPENYEKFKHLRRISTNFVDNNVYMTSKRFTSALDWGWIILPNGPYNEKKDYTEISFELFEKHYLKPQSMEKKIIGYKAPMDLFKGRIKKGAIFNKYSTDNFVMYNEKHMTSGIATEIVETWEPVYEKLEKEFVLKSGKKLTIKPEGVDTGNRIILIADIIRIAYHKGQMTNYTSVAGFDTSIIEFTFKIGCVEILNSELLQIIEIHKSL